MSRPLPPLTALRAFDAAARQGSFAGAAAELEVTPAAISHQVRRLETYLGVHLFRRLPGGLRLTEAGEAIRPDVNRAFGHLANAMDRLHGGTAPHTITATVAPSLAARWLVPRIEDFHRAHPGFELRIDARDELVDPHRDDIDVALRYGGGDHPDLHVDELPALSVFPVCNPDLLAHGPAPAGPRDLLVHALLHVEWRHTKVRTPADWAEWFERLDTPVEAPLPGPRFGQHSMAIDAAVAGQGIALANELLVCDDLAAGRLVCPLDARVADPLGYFLVCLPESTEAPRVRAFRDWIARASRADIGAHPATTAL